MENKPYENLGFIKLKRTYNYGPKYIQIDKIIGIGIDKLDRGTTVNTKAGYWWVEETPQQIFKLINKKESKMKTNYENAMSTKEEYEEIKKELAQAEAKMNEFKKKAKKELEWILEDEKIEKE